MALHYNLAKVYAISDEDPDFVSQVIDLFVIEVPVDIEQVRIGIDARDYKQTYSFAHKIKPSLDLLGLDLAFEEVLQIEDWANKEGKRKEIIEVYKSLAHKIEKAVKEMKKDFNLLEKIKE